LRLRPSFHAGSSKARCSTSIFERGTPNPAVQALFDRAHALRVGFYVGYAELTPDGRSYNCAILVDRDGDILGRYRKVHLPGSIEPRPGARYQQLEKSAISNMATSAFPPPAQGRGDTQSWA
jgi:predicted amidohydrolase